MTVLGLDSLLVAGGRASGDGETTADQLYFFNASSPFTHGIGFPLVRDAIGGGVGPGNQCLTLNSDGFLSNTPCAPPLFTPQQTWIISSNSSITSPPTTSSVQAGDMSTECPAAVTLTQIRTITASAPASTNTAFSENFTLPVPSPTFDATANRAATGVQIRSASSPDICFDVSNFRAGDFRFNLVPLALKKCDGAVDGQRFDLITKGGHNNAEDGSRTLIVSSQQFTCIDRRSNINDRTRPGLFACRGRAASDGETTPDQQYFFNSSTNPSSGIGFPIARDAVDNGLGPGNQCLTFNADGFTWIISNSTPAEPSVPSLTLIPTATTVSLMTFASTLLAASQTSSTATPVSSSVAGAPEKFVLPVPSEGPGPLYDTTATRAATSAQIKSAASRDICFDVSNFRAGDFRFNLVPLALKKCDSRTDGQRFDLITKGVHNNILDGSRTLIVSSQQFTCVDRLKNKNDRTRPGLFACGGRAVGDGETQSDEQFFFNSTASLSGGIGPGNQCLTLNVDGFVSNGPCTPPFFTSEQTWIVS